MTQIELKQIFEERGYNVKESLRVYNALIKQGRSENYADAYVDSLDADDAEPDIFAQAVEDAIANGYDKEEAHYFAATCSFRYDYDGDRVPNTVQNLIKYPSDWQHTYIFHWLAKARASANYVNNEEDFCKIFEQNCKCLEGNISEDDIYQVEIDTLKEYSYNHTK